MQAIWHYKQQLRLNSLQSLFCTSESLSKEHPSLQKNTTIIALLVVLQCCLMSAWALADIAEFIFSSDQKKIEFLVLKD